MARVTVPLQTLDPEDSVVLSYTAADATNDHAFTNTGRVLLLVKTAAVPASP